MSGIATDVYSSKQGKKKPKVDVNQRREIPHVQQGGLPLNELVPAFFDAIHGRFDRQALSSINRACETINTALVDFERHPELRVGDTLPEARSYLLGGIVNLMKTCGMSRKDIKGALDIFKNRMSLESAEVIAGIDSYFNGRIPDTKSGDNLRALVDSAKRLTTIVIDKDTSARNLDALYFSIAGIWSSLNSLKDGFFDSPTTAL